MTSLAPRAVVFSPWQSHLPDSEPRTPHAGSGYEDKGLGLVLPLSCANIG